MCVDAGGWVGHVWHAHNSFASVWMNDREYMTFGAVHADPPTRQLRAVLSACAARTDLNLNNQKTHCVHRVIYLIVGCCGRWVFIGVFWPSNSTGQDAHS